MSPFVYDQVGRRSHRVHLLSVVAFAAFLGCDASRSPAPAAPAPAAMPEPAASPAPAAMAEPAPARPAVPEALPRDVTAPTPPQNVAPDVTAPSVPSAVSAALASPTEAYLRWSPSTDDVGVAGYEVLRGEQVVASPRDPAARVAGLAPGRRHCFSVRALDGAGNRSGAAEPVCIATADVTPPGAPSGLVAQAGPARVELRWGASTDDVGVVGYEVVRDGAVVAKASGTNASEGGLKAAAKYCYEVRALDAAGNRSPLAGPACAVPPDVTPPTVPDALTARGDSETSIVLRWHASTDDVGVVRYEILRNGEVVSRPEATELRIAGLKTAVEYCHAVRACDAAGNCSVPSPPVCTTTPDLTPPTMVTQVSAKAQSDKQIEIRWAPAHDNVGVARYEIRRGGETVMTIDGAVTHAENEGLSPARRYCYTVVAVDAAGNASPPSEAACAVPPDLTPPTVPENVVAAPRSGHEIVVAWNRSTDDVDVAGYEVVRGNQVVAKVERTQTTVTLLAPETDYCHAVRAFDAAGNRSNLSREACAKTVVATSPTAPLNLHTERSPRQELILAWEPSPDPGIVYVVYSDSGEHGETRIGTTPTRAFKVFGQAAAERHCYRVSALDEARGESPRTFPVCAAAHKSRQARADASLAAQ